MRSLKIEGQKLISGDLVPKVWNRMCQDKTRHRYRLLGCGANEKQSIAHKTRVVQSWPRSHYHSGLKIILASMSSNVGMTYAWCTDICAGNTMHTLFKKSLHLNFLKRLGKERCETGRVTDWGQQRNLGEVEIGGYEQNTL